MSFDFVEFGVLALAHFIALLSPGPDFILILGSSIRYGHRRTFTACLGITLANGLYIILAIGGFSLLRTHQLLFRGMQAMAAAYLFYLGLLLLKSPRPTEPGKDAATPLVKEPQPRLLLRGFLSAILNPKNAVFYLSLMALIVSRRTPVAHQVVYGGWMVCAVLFWDMLVAWLIGNPLMRSALQRHTWRIERLSGVLLMTVGVFIVLK